jgi:NADH-quinone oxidoreductase subunit J
MDISPLAFYFFAGLAIACAALVVLKKNPVSSAFNLILVFVSFAAIYATLGAHLLAALQVLVYAGAIMVLFIFVIMLLNADEPSFDASRTHPVLKGVSVGFCAILLVAFVWIFQKTGAGAAAPVGFTVQAIEASGGNTKVISQIMFTKYILPFEIASVLILTGIVGAVAIAKRKLGKEGK